MHCFCHCMFVVVIRRGVELVVLRPHSCVCLVSADRVFVRVDSRFFLQSFLTFFVDRSYLLIRRGRLVVCVFENKTLDRVGQYHLVLDFPVSEPLSSDVLHAMCVSSDVFGVACVWFVVCSNLRVEVSSNQHVYACVCFPASVGALLQLRVHLLYALVTISRVWDVNSSNLQFEFLFSMVTRMILGPKRFTSLMCFVPSLVDEDCSSVACFDVPLSMRRCPCLVIHNSSICGHQVSLIAPKSQ